MGRCNCSADGACSCLVTAGDGILIVGSGEPLDPYVITLEGVELHLVAEDSSTVEMRLNGTGTPSDPFRLSASSLLDLTDLGDVDQSDSPSSGDVPIWTTSGGPGRWTFGPPSLTPGSIYAEDGIDGDGSVGDPLVAKVSGTWGVPPLEGPDSTVGALVYVDSAGELRAEPFGASSPVPWGNVTGKPTAFPTTWETVTGKPVHFPTTWSKVQQTPATFPSAWATTSGKPDTFPPATHTHAQGEVAGLSSRLDLHEQGLDNLDALKVSGAGDTSTAPYANGSLRPLDVTTGSGYPVWVDLDGNFARETSSLRYKKNLRAPDPINPYDVLRLHPVVYDRVDGSAVGEYGLIAEQVEKLFPRLVVYDQRGRPDSVRYDKVALEFLPWAQDMTSLVTDLRARVGALEKRLTGRE